MAILNGDAGAAAMAEQALTEVNAALTELEQIAVEGRSA